MKYIYGPVYSWRLGESLGIDLLSQKDKICNFDCSYCQVGETPFYSTERKVYVPTSDILEELKNFANVKIDYITFSGKGEPTLAKNLGEVILEIRKVRKEPVAILTNSTLLNMPDVVKDLLLADNVSCKLDAATDKTFELVSRQDKSIKINNIIEGIKKFREIYKGQLALQIMFLKENIIDAPKLADAARYIGVDVIQLNTPTRHNVTNAVNESEMKKISEFFKGFKYVSVYDKPLKMDNPMNRHDTMLRRGN